MFIEINGIKMPFEEDKNIEPICIQVAIAENSTSRWLGSIEIELDEGADSLSIPLDVLAKMGIYPRPNSDQVTVQMADGSKSNQIQMTISLRIEATNGEVIALHDVRCVCPQTGACLIGRNVFQVFRKTVTQNKLEELVLCPKARTWLGMLNA